MNRRRNRSRNGRFSRSSIDTFHITAHLRHGLAEFLFTGERSRREGQMYSVSQQPLAYIDSPHDVVDWIYKEYNNTIRYTSCNSLDISICETFTSLLPLFISLLSLFSLHLTMFSPSVPIDGLTTRKRHTSCSTEIFIFYVFFLLKNMPAGDIF